MNLILPTLAAGNLAKALGGVTGNMPILNTGVAAVAMRIAARSVPLTLAVAGAGLALRYFVGQQKKRETAAAAPKRRAAAHKSAKAPKKTTQRRPAAAAA